MKAGWQTRRLIDLCELFADGDWIESKDQADNGIRLIQTGNVGPGFFKDRSEKARYISPETFTRLRCQEIFPGDCLVSRLPDPAGRSCLLPEVGERMITAVDCTIIRFRKNQLQPAFFNYFAQSQRYLADVVARCTGTTRNRVSRSNLGEIEIPTPSLKEQERIVTILDEAFAGIATAKALASTCLKRSSDVFQVALHAAYRRARNSAGSVQPFSSVLLHQPRNGWSPPKEFQTGEGTPVLTLSSVTGFEYDGSRIKLSSVPTREGAHYWLQPGELLVTRSNTKDLVGHVAIYDGTPEHAICCDLIMKMTVSPNKALTRFAYYMMRSPEIREYLSNSSQGANSTMSKIGKSVIQDLPIPIPALNEQQKIVENLDRLMEGSKALLSLYRSKLVALDALKQSLLHQAFTGKL